MSSKNAGDLPKCKTCKMSFQIFRFEFATGRDIEKLRGQVSENMILHDIAFKLLFSARFWEHLKMFKRFNTMALPLLVGQT